MNARLTALLPLLLAGCSMAPDDVRPPSPVPASWPVGDAYLRQSEASLPVVSYRDVFVDPRLQTLIGQALVNNRDLRVAAANIAAAVLVWLWPDVGLLLLGVALVGAVAVVFEVTTSSTVAAVCAGVAVTVLFGALWLVFPLALRNKVGEPDH